MFSFSQSVATLGVEPGLPDRVSPCTCYTIISIRGFLFWPTILLGSQTANCRMERVSGAPASWEVLDVEIGL